MNERIAHDVAYMSAVYMADKQPQLPEDRSALMAVIFDLVYSGIAAYADIVRQERPRAEFSAN